MASSPGGSETDSDDSVDITSPGRVRASPSVGGAGTPSKRSRASRSEKNLKGLRHFSKQVCQKVKDKGKTTYNEVADELVKQFAEQAAAGDTSIGFDEKNIRRRVYDALNVLMAMEIITKHKKEIQWRGLPSSMEQEVSDLAEAKAKVQVSINRKKEQLRDLAAQHLALKRLIARNRQAPAAGQHIALPFIIVATDHDTTINLEMDAPKRQDLFFSFSKPFEIHDDAEILHMMKLHLATPAEKEMILPPDVLPYLEDSSEDANGADRQRHSVYT